MKLQDFDNLAQEVLARGLNLRIKVNGKSMHPFICNDDILIIEPRSAAEINIGDIILNRQPSGTYIVHRLIRRNGAMTLVTKGDSQSSYDIPFAAEQVIGRVVQIEGRSKRMKLTGGPGRGLGWTMAQLDRGRGRTMRRIRRNLGRLWWLMGGRRIK